MYGRCYGFIFKVLFPGAKMEEKCIIAVSNFPVIYDSSLDIYRNVQVKNYAWRDVVQIVGSDGKCRLNILMF